MAATFYRIQDSEDVWGKHRVIAYDILLDTYNLTNGIVINAGDVGLVRITGAQIVGSNKAGGAVHPCLDFGTLTGSEQSSVALRLFNPTGGATAPATLTAPVGTMGGSATAAAQTVTMGGTATGTIPGGATPVTSTSAQPAVSVPATGLTATAGTSAVPASGLTAALTGGIGKEVANATDVSTLTYRVLFFGY